LAVSARVPSPSPPDAPSARVPKELFEVFGVAWWCVLVDVKVTPTTKSHRVRRQILRVVGGIILQPFIMPAHF
jgi:hypothetical protein